MVSDGRPRSSACLGHRYRDPDVPRHPAPHSDPRHRVTSAHRRPHRGPGHRSQRESIIAQLAAEKTWLLAAARTGPDHAAKVLSDFAYLIGGNR
jgi:hypothetical protein